MTPASFDFPVPLDIRSLTLEQNAAVGTQNRFTFAEVVTSRKLEELVPATAARGDADRGRAEVQEYG